MRTPLASLLAACLLLPGCTRVGFQSPVGKPLPVSELDSLIGEWLGERGTVWTVDRDPASGHLRARCVEDGKPKTELFLVTTLDDKDTSDKYSLAWIKQDDVPAYVPLRILGAEDALALLYPDDDFLKRLVAEGKANATFHETENIWIMPPGDWTALLERPDFWKLTTCLPFVRAHPSKASAAPPPTPKPASP